MNRSNYANANANAVSNRDIIINIPDAGSISIPEGVPLPAIGGGTTEEKVQSWSKDEYGSSIIGLVPVLITVIYKVTGIVESSLTTESIKKAQEIIGVTVDGIIGPETYAALGIENVDIVFKKSAGGSMLPAVADIGGLWYQNPYVYYGGGLAIFALIGYGVYRYMR